MMHSLTHNIYYDLAVTCGHRGPHGQPQPHVNELSRLCHEPYNAWVNVEESHDRGRGSSCKVTVNACGFSRKKKILWWLNCLKNQSNGLAFMHWPTVHVTYYHCCKFLILNEYSNQNKLSYFFDLQLDQPLIVLQFLTLF